MKTTEAICYLTPIRNSASLKHYRDALTTAIDALEFQRRHEHPLTNADRIRSMTDEEMAKWLLTPADLCGQCDTHEFCTGYPDNKDERCITAVIKYIRQPVKEG